MPYSSRCSGLVGRRKLCLVNENMIDDISDIAAHYNSEPEREHSRLERHQLEHELTWRYLNQYLPSKGEILEIGAASGRYTVELAKRGYAVTAVDLSAVLIERCQQQLNEAGVADRVLLLVADARDLSVVGKKEFDAVLMMGPLYHLIEEADRTLALKQAFDRLRTGGIIFSAFISRYGLFGDLIKRMPEWIEKQTEVRGIIEQGSDPEHFPRTGFRGYFARVSEIAPLHESVGFETLVLAGVEPAISADDESFNRLEGKERQLWLDLLFEISTEPSIIAASRHLLYIGRKRD